MKYCENCGAALAPGRRFCTSCGLAVAAQEPGLGPYAGATGQQVSRTGPDSQLTHARQQWGSLERAGSTATRRVRPVGVIAALAFAVLFAGAAAAAFVLVGHSDDDTETAGSTAQTNVGPIRPTTVIGGVPTGGPSAPSTGTIPPAPLQTSVAAVPATPTAAVVGSPPPYSTPFWTVIVSSLTEAQGGQAAAQAFGANLTAAGYPFFVFYSTPYTSLEPNYWVTAAGGFADKSAADSMSYALAGLGFDPSYPRCVGAAFECPD